jgi:hypothetical protein
MSGSTESGAGRTSTTDWLAEASFHVALDMSDSAEEFAANLGWGDRDV